MGGQQQQQRLLTLLFKAHFEETQDIGDIEMLSDRAERAGMMSKERVRHSSLCIRSPRSSADMFSVSRRLSISSTRTSASKR